MNQGTETRKPDVDDNSKSRAQLIEELTELRERVTQLTRDATAHKHLEDTLQESGQHYRGIFDESVTAIYIFDNEKNFTASNQAGLELLGYAREELLSMSIPDVDADPSAVLPAHEQLLSGGRIVNYEHKLRKKDGSVISVLNNSRPLTDAQGNVTGMLSTLIDITERKQAEEALSSSEAKYRTLVDNVLQGVVIAQAEPVRLAFANPAMERLLGYKVEELTGMGPEELASLVWEGDRQRFFDSFHKRLHGNEMPQESVYRFVCKDSSTKWVTVWSSVIEYLDEPATLTTFTDITERKQAEVKLQESEERYRLLADNATDVIWTMNMEQQFTYCSPSVLGLRGYTPSEAMGETLEEAITPESYEQAALAIAEEFARDGEVGVPPDRHRSLELEQYCRDGSTVWVEVKTAFLRDSSGSPNGVIGITRDITERKQAEEQLQYRLELESLIASIATRFIGPLPEGIDSVAQDALRLIGEFTGADRSNIFMLSEDGSRMDNTHEWCAAGVEPQIENRQGLPSAKFPWWMEQLQQDECLHIPRVADMSPQAGAEQAILQAQGIQSLIVLPIAYGGVLLGFLGFDSVRHEKHWQTEDMTLLRTVGEVLANAWVRQQAVARERELQERAEEQEKLAAVGQLAAGIAHDFNNLLTGILGHAEMMTMMPTLPQEFHSSVHIIQRQGRRAAQLIQQILDFSRKSIRQSSPVDLLPFLKEMLCLLQRTIPEHIDIHLDAIPGRYIVSADPTQLQQVFTNLAVNARDAMPEGGELRFHLSSLVLGSTDPRPLPDMPAGGSKWVVATLSDTGTGISKEVLPHIYEPFFTTKAVGQGSGLGLSQVYGIVMQHEGFLDVQSTLGEGTTFVLYLPAQEVRTEPLSSVEHSDFPRGRGESVLVVEDESVVLEVLKLALESLGYDVLTAQNGQEALDIYAQHGAVNDGTVHGDEPVWGNLSESIQCFSPVDLVLTDIMMPMMGGVELCQKLRQHHEDVKVVLISGYPLEADAVELLADGVVGWVQKPPSVQTLAQVVRDAIEQH